MVDIHSHILPEVDDGAKSWEMAIHMCRMAAEDGIDHMVATPHANEQFAYDRNWLSSVMEELRQRIGPAPKLTLGCDFHFSYENLQDLEQHPQRYTIGETPYLLIELSDYALPAMVGEKLEDLIASGLRPILTHPERNPMLMGSPHKVLRWAQNGLIVQVTASALTGLWGERSRQVAEWLLKRQAVHVVASDAHSIDGRPPILSQAREVVAELSGPDVATALVEHNPRAIVNGRELPYFPRPEI